MPRRQPGPEHYGRTDGVPVREDRRYKHPEGLAGTPGVNAKTARGRDLLEQAHRQAGNLIPRETR